MGGTTPSQALRYPYVDDVITENAQGFLGADIAAKLTTQDAARTAVLQKPFVYMSSNTQATADGTDTAIIWASIILDPNSLVNLGLNPTRITPGTANIGLWKFTLSVSFALGASITRLQVSAAVTGTTKMLRTYFTNSSSFGIYVLSGQVQVPAGTDYIEFKVTHNGGGSQNIQGASVMAWQASA